MSETPETNGQPLPEPEPPKPGTPAGRKIERQLRDVLAAVIIGLAPVDPRRAGILNEHAADLARVWARLAAENPAVRRALEAMLSGSAWGEAVFVTAAVAIKMLPEGWESPFTIPGLGGVPPSDEVAAAEAARAAEDREPPAEGPGVNVTPIRPGDVPAPPREGPSAAPQSIPEQPSDGSGDGEPPDTPA